MNAHHRKRSYRPPPPKSTARFSSGTVDEGASSLKKAVERVPFGWQLDALVPATGSSTSSEAAVELEKLVGAIGGYYVCEGVNLAHLLEPEFMNSFVRNGSLVALSLDDDEGADVVAIDGRGRLILSVPKDTYELLGLPGRASAFGSFRQRFIIEISLIDPATRAGKPGFERVKRLLRDWPIQTDLFDALAGVGTNGETKETKGKRFDLVMCYTDDAGTPQPLSFPTSVSAALHQPTLTRHHLSSIRVPSSSSFPPSTPFAKRQRTSSGAFRKAVDEPALFWDQYREWAGLAQLGERDKLEWREGADEEEEWGVPLDASEKGEVTTMTWTGMLHPKALAKLVEQVSQQSTFTYLPFLSLTLRTFPHSPISHLSAADPPVVGTSKKPNGKKRKRGRGRGEEEEAKRERLEEAGGWEFVLRSGEGGKTEWSSWQGQ